MIYFLQRENGDIKIGTSKTFGIRLSQLNAEYGAMILLGAMEGDYELEQEIHGRLSHDGRYWLTRHG